VYICTLQSCTRRQLPTYAMYNEYQEITYDSNSWMWTKKLGEPRICHASQTHKNNKPANEVSAAFVGTLLADVLRHWWKTKGKCWTRKILWFPLTHKAFPCIENRKFCSTLKTREQTRCKKVVHVHSSLKHALTYMIPYIHRQGPSIATNKFHHHEILSIWKPTRHGFENSWQWWEKMLMSMFTLAWSTLSFTWFLSMDRDNE
jgi:hypothetical protein